jgi:hypothetical protein
MTIMSARRGPKTLVSTLKPHYRFPRISTCLWRDGPGRSQYRFRRGSGSSAGSSREARRACYTQAM